MFIIFKLYNDLLIEIESYKSDIKIDTDSRDKLFKQLNPNSPSDMKSIGYDGMPKGSRDYTSLDRLYKRHKDTIDMLNIVIEEKTERLNKKELEKKKQEDQFKLCEGLSHKVFDLHRIQHKQLKEVATILGYSYQYIKEINNQIDKEILNDK